MQHLGCGLCDTAATISSTVLSVSAATGIGCAASVAAIKLSFFGSRSINFISFSTFSINFSSPSNVSVQGISSPPWGRSLEYCWLPVTLHLIELLCLKNSWYYGQQLFHHLSLQQQQTGQKDCQFLSYSWKFFHSWPLKLLGKYGINELQNHIQKTPCFMRNHENINPRNYHAFWSNEILNPWN